MSNEGYKILDSAWRTGMYEYIIGFVAIETRGGWRAFIGCVKPFSEKCDAQAIAARGCKLKKEEALAFMPNLDPDKFVEG